MKPNGYLSVKGWTKFQHYSKRNPPWIKMHRDLLYDYEFRCLPDSQKAHLMLIWLLASQIGNRIPNDASWITERIGCHENVDISALIESGFLIPDSNALAYLKNIDSSCAIAETETETETEKKDIEKKEPPDIIPVKKPRKVAPKSLKQKRFREFYDIYPKHVAAKSAENYWEKAKLDDKCDMILADVINRTSNHKAWLEGFIPNPRKYLEEERWNDQIQRRPGNGNRTDQASLRSNSPRDRHEEALKRKHGQDHGEVMGQDDVIVW